MASVVMREIREGEVPFAAGTAIQEDPNRPAFRGNGPNDYVCVRCGNVLAESMHPMQMTKKVRVRCGRCSTVNVAANDESDDAATHAAGGAAAVGSGDCRGRTSS